MLINAGADVNVTDICHKRLPGTIFKSCVQNVGQTPLMKAFIYYNFKCVDRLTEGGAHKNVKDECGQTLLIISAAYGYDKCLSSLIKTGVDLNARDMHGQMALIKAAIKDFINPYINL